MSIQQGLSSSPLTVEEIVRIDSTSLSITDKHYLRLLAHCLACFKAMTEKSQQRTLPMKEVRLQWCSRQPCFQGEESFVLSFMTQLDVAGRKLEEFAKKKNLAPLDLTLDLLIDICLENQNI